MGRPVTTSPKRLLLVDDEESLLIALTDYLEFEGFEVEKARSAEEALRRVERFDPDLVVLDIAMPGMGGVGFLREVCDPDGRPRYPILVLTARGNMAGFFENFGVDAFLAKPCEKGRLLSTINEVLSRVARDAIAEREGGGKTREILFGEDDPTAFEKVESAFSSADYAVTRAETGPEVLATAAPGRFDLIFVKAVLTHMNGQAVAALLKAMPSTRDVPVIIYGETSVCDDGGRLRSSDVSVFVDGHDPRDLLDAAESLLRGQSGR